MSGQMGLKVDPARAAALTTELTSVRQRVAAVAKTRDVRIVAVSKLKPANDVLALWLPPAAHRHFGENYAQELRGKAGLLPQDIRWHFIGGLQSSHCKTLAKIPNLWVVSSVDTIKKAELLNRHRGEAIAAAAAASSSSPDAPDTAEAEAAAPTSSTPSPPSPTTPTPTPSPPGKLNVHVQVNTSGEESKSGCAPGPDTVALCRYVEEEAGNLHLLGLMTIGAIGRSVATATATATTSDQTADNDDDDFLSLKAQRDLVARELRLDRHLELSMGMSQDFEGAVALGSDEVRLGTTIFGVRGPKSEAKITV